MLDREYLTSDLLADYALGFLSPEEAAEVEAALERFPEAWQELNAYLGGLSDLVMDLEPQSVPAGAEDRLMARLNTEVLGVRPTVAPVTPSNPNVSLSAGPAGVTPAPGAPAPSRARWLAPLLGLAAAAALGVAILPGLLNRTPDFASYQAQPGAVTATINDKAGAAVAKVVRLIDGHTYVQMQASVPAGRAYQAWKIEGGKPVSLGMFKGQDYLAEVPAGTVFAVTVEPEGGSPQPTSAPLFAQSI